ncbi:MAG: hypothetical protein NC228_01510 [[Eubacterium] siraeum]|nr:hypothetical protein [[Eubacterium] siraeum]
MREFKINAVIAAALAAVLAVSALFDKKEEQPLSQEPIHTTCKAVVCRSAQDEAPQTAVPAEKEEEKLQLPKVKSNVKFFTDYRSYNLWYTPHYRLQQAAWTDEQGLRRFNEDYIVALGSYYSTRIGDRFCVTLDTGRSFTVIVGDGKWDEDCDSLCMYTPCIDNGGFFSKFEPDEETLKRKIEKIRKFHCFYQKCIECTAKYPRKKEGKNG